MNEASQPEETKDFLVSDSKFESSEAVMAQNANIPMDMLIEETKALKAQEEAILEKAEAALHKVIEASAHNQATEKLFELKHEVKDEQSIHHPSLKNHVASIGQLLDSRAQTYTQVAHNNTPSAERTGYIRSVLTNNNLYSQAIRYGFAVAILSLFTAILIAMLFT